jgi:ABC-type glycerol-3-phosphate transport system substrate-binding protein
MLQKAVDNLRSTNQVTKNLSPDELKSLQTKMQATVKTWQDLADITPYLTIKSGNDISQSAIALGTSTNVERSYDILSSIMMQNGTQMTTSSLDSASFNLQQAGAAQSSNPGKDALDFYLRFANPSDPLYTWNNSMPNSVDAFENGQAAMLIHFASAYRYIVNDAPAIKSSIQVDPLPQVSDPASPTSQGSLKTMANMLVETVPSARGDAARQKAAWTFVHYATTKQGAAPYLSAMKLPSALNDGSDHGQFQAFNDQKKLGDLWYKGNSALKINEIFINMINQAATGEKSSKDALDSAAAQVTGFLQTSTWKWSVTGSNLNVSNVGSK